MRKVFISIPAVAILLLLPWVTSVTYGASPGSPFPDGARIEAADRTAAPRATFFGDACGGVIPGDLFYIDAAGGPSGLTASLYITNADELTRYLRYLILRVTLYSAGEDGRWQPVSLEESATCLTLRNSPVKFALGGSPRYKIAVDSGSYYCQPARAGRDHQPPKFYLTLGTG